MKLPTIFKFSGLELVFLFTAFIVFLLGTIISTKLHQPGLMPGVGAVMIVLGVVFALFDLPNILALNANKLFKLRIELSAHSRISEQEDETHDVVSEQDQQRIRKEEKERVERHLPNQEPNIRKRFHLVEVFIICSGTLVNGFGQFALECYLK